MIIILILTEKDKKRKENIYVILFWKVLYVKELISSGQRKLIEIPYIHSLVYHLNNLFYFGLIMLLIL